MRPATKEQRVAQESRDGDEEGGKIEEPSFGLIWQMQSRKQEAVPVGVEELNRMFFFFVITSAFMQIYVRL